MPIIYAPVPIKDSKTSRFKTTLTERTGTIVEKLGPSVKVFFDDATEPTYISARTIVIPIE